MILQDQYKPSSVEQQTPFGVPLFSLKVEKWPEKITIVATPEYLDIPMWDQVPGESKHLLLACNILAKFYEEVWITRVLQ